MHMDLAIRFNYGLIVALVTRQRKAQKFWQVYGSKVLDASLRCTGEYNSESTQPTL